MIKIITSARYKKLLEDADYKREIIDLIKACPKTIEISGSGLLSIDDKGELLTTSIGGVLFDDSHSLVVNNIKLTPVLDVVTGKYEMFENMQEYVDLDSGEKIYTCKSHEGKELELVLETKTKAVYRHKGMYLVRKVV